MAGIHINPAHKGLLHRDLGIPEGQPIPEDALQSALNSSDPAVRKRAQFAQNAKHFNHAEPSGVGIQGAASRRPIGRKGGA